MPNHTTFTDDIIDGVHVLDLKAHTDDRGWLTELFRADEMGADQAPAMGYASETKPGVKRGPHEHANQTDHFVVIGAGVFEFCLWDDRKDSPTTGKRMKLTAGGDHPRRISVPPGVVHAYKNISSEPAVLLNFPNALYAGDGRKDPVDEIRYENVEDHPFTW